ncbi:DUF3168 domain-containing protein [Lutimaribacter marinistellae]|uniref:DUF3168 domain-containing protein n=1 Tax=Lutimaribacter marinistellae TaxID=1820329 RepID=A0ABV7TH69_9RHOB
MSYGMAAALQTAIYATLSADPRLSGLVHDALPEGELPETYVRLGPEEVREASDREGGGALHRFTVSVISGAAGFAGAKDLAGAVCDRLEDAPPVLARGRIVGIWFERAKAGTSGGLRRIDLRFRARLEDN